MGNDSAPVSSDLHAAIIMDGNGRWARARGLPREAGHKAGADAVRRTVEAAPGLGIRYLTLYAFSTDNWKRPSAEIAALMRLMRIYLLKEVGRCVENGVRVSVIGRRDRLPGILSGLIENAERETAAGDRLHLRIAIDYSSRDAILGAVERLRASESIDRESFSKALHAACHSDLVKDVDMVIRTSGEQRLSDFLLWESAYAELYFTPRMWPDFDAGDLAAAVAEYHKRERRFGEVKATAVG